MKLFFYDLETTGVNPAKNSIHQISGQIFIDGVNREIFDIKMQPNPKAEITEEALEVCGVTREQILSYPATFEDGYIETVQLLNKYVNRYNKKDKFTLIGYNNAPFDNNFFRGLFLQNGDEYFGSWFWANTIDVMCLATLYLMDKRTEMENFQLRTVAKTLGIPVDETKLHDGQYDIYLTVEVFKIITNNILNLK